MKKQKKQLSIGDTITTLVVDGSIQTGQIETFGEHTVILSQGVKRFVVKKEYLANEGYCFPKYKRAIFN